MRVVKITVVMPAFLLFQLTSFAQGGDTTKSKKLLSYITDKFPGTRTFNIEYSQFTPHKYSSELLGEKLPEGKITNTYQLKFDANVNLVRKKTWFLSATVNYRYTALELENVSPLISEPKAQKEDFHYHASALNFTKYSRLFRKPIIYSGSVIVDGSDKHFERVRGFAAATMMLRADRTTKIGIGIVGIVDPSSQTPVMPTFIYERKFGDRWMLDIMLPQRLMIRKEVFGNGRLSVGTELGGPTFYLYGFSGNAGTYQFRQTELNSGLTYEHHLGRSIIGTVRTGVRNVINSRVFEKGESFGDYIYKVQPDAAFYFNVGISFNPFKEKNR